MISSFRPRPVPVIRRVQPFGQRGPFFFLAFDLERGRVWKLKKTDCFVEAAYYNKSLGGRCSVRFSWKEDGIHIGETHVRRARLIYATGHNLDPFGEQMSVMDVHHLNGDSQDDRLENLRLIDPITHRLQHRNEHRAAWAYKRNSRPGRQLDLFG